MVRYLMEAQHQLHQAWSVDHCQRAQRHYSDDHDYGNNSSVHYVAPDVILLFYKYASASRTVSREACEAGVRVASAAPRMTTRIQMTVPNTETLNGIGVLRNKLPSPTPITHVTARAGSAATTQLTAAIKMPSNTTRRATRAPDAPMAFITPNSRVRSRTFVLMVEPRAIKPTIPMVDAMSKITPTKITEWPSVV